MNPLGRDSVASDHPIDREGCLPWIKDNTGQMEWSKHNPMGPSQIQKHFYSLVSYLREKSFNLLDLLWVPKGRWRECMIKKEVDVLVWELDNKESWLKSWCFRIVVLEKTLERLMLKLQYFGHLMQRADSSEKTLMLG